MIAAAAETVTYRRRTSFHTHKIFTAAEPGTRTTAKKLQLVVVGRHHRRHLSLVETSTTDSVRSLAANLVPSRNGIVRAEMLQVNYGRNSSRATHGYLRPSNTLVERRKMNSGYSDNSRPFECEIRRKNLSAAIS